MCNCVLRTMVLVGSEALVGLVYIRRKPIVSYAQHQEVMVKQIEGKRK